PHGTSHLAARDRRRCMTCRPADPPAVPLALAAIAIGFAIHVRDGEYTPFALSLITVAMVMAAAAVVSPDKGLRRTVILAVPRPRGEDGATVAVLAGGLAVQLFALALTWPAGVDQTDLGRTGHRLFLAGLAAVAALAGIGLVAVYGPWRRVWFPLVLAVQFMLGAWMVRASPEPHIDVWVFQ